jgi:hypothetical protein
MDSGRNGFTRRNIQPNKGNPAGATEVEPEALSYLFESREMQCNYGETQSSREEMRCTSEAMSYEGEVMTFTGKEMRYKDKVISCKDCGK